MSILEYYLWIADFIPEGYRPYVMTVLTFYGTILSFIMIGKLLRDTHKLVDPKLNAFFDPIVAKLRAQLFAKFPKLTKFGEKIREKFNKKK